MGVVRSNASDALKLSDHATPGEILPVYESVKEVKETNPGRFRAIVIDLGICATVPRRKGWKYLFTQRFRPSGN
jgi:hypothetical protein